MTSYSPLLVVAGNAMLLACVVLKLNVSVGFRCVFNFPFSVWQMHLPCLHGFNGNIKNWIKSN